MNAIPTRRPKWAPYTPELNPTVNWKREFIEIPNELGFCFDIDGVTNIRMWRITDMFNKFTSEEKKAWLEQRLKAAMVVAPSSSPVEAGSEPTPQKNPE